MHVVPEGHVDVYYRFGKLLPEITETGLRIKIPVLTNNYHISTIFQSDVVKNVHCRLKQGVLITFENVEVFNILNQRGVIPIIKAYGVNYDQVLIYSTVRNYVGSICRNYTVDDILINFTEVQNKLTDEIQNYINTRTLPQSGSWGRTADQNINNSIENALLHILSTRLSTPIIPKQILERYEKLEEEKVNKRIAEMNKQVVLEKLATQKEESSIHNTIFKEKETIRMEIRLKEAKMHAQAKEIEANANEKLLTDKYLTLKRIGALGNNTKIFFGTTGDKLLHLFYKLQKLSDFIDPFL